MSRLGIAVALVVAVTLVAGLGWAHQTDESEHHVEIRPAAGEVEQLLSISAKDLAHHLGHLGHGEQPSEQLLERIREELREYLADHTGIIADEQVCEPVTSDFVEYPAESGRVHFHQKFDCPAEPDEVTVANRVMFDGHHGYRHTAQIQVGDQISTTVFDRDYPTFAVSVPKPDDGGSDERETADDVDEEVVETAETTEETGTVSADTDNEREQPGVGTAMKVAAVVVVALAMTVGFAWRRRDERAQ